MTQKFKNLLLKKVSFVPGLVGFAPIDFSVKKKTLSEEEFSKSFSFEETSKGLIIRIAIIVDIDIRAKLVIKEINSAVKTICKTNNEKLNKVMIYVMGVK